MSAVKLSIILPSVQVPLAIALWEWSSHEPHPRKLGYVPWPTDVLICYGINAPAIFFSRLASYPLRMASPPWFLARYNYAELTFFVGVALLWFLVGTAADRKMTKFATERQVTALTALWHALLLLVGVLVLLEGLRGFLLPWHRGNYWGTITESILCVAWSVALIGSPILSYFKRHRRG